VLFITSILHVLTTSILPSCDAVAGAWESVVRPTISTSDISIVRRDNGFDVNIAIAAQPSYAISEPETIQVIVPASMLASEQVSERPNCSCTRTPKPATTLTLTPNPAPALTLTLTPTPTLAQAIYASPAFVIEVAGAQGTSLTGSLAHGVSEDELSSGILHNLTLTLDGDTWLHSLPQPALLAGLVSSAYEPHGWMASVRPSLSLDHFTGSSPRVERGTCTCVWHGMHNNTQHARATRNMQHTACNMQHAT
jgi:hypothetical protein